MKYTNTGTYLQKTLVLLYLHLLLVQMNWTMSSKVESLHVFSSHCNQRGQDDTENEIDYQYPAIFFQGRGSQSMHAVQSTFSFT
jgi:hypothetical protein